MGFQSTSHSVPDGRTSVETSWPMQHRHTRLARRTSAGDSDNKGPAPLQRLTAPRAAGPGMAGGRGPGPTAAKSTAPVRGEGLPERAGVGDSVSRAECYTCPRPAHRTGSRFSAGSRGAVASAWHSSSEGFQVRTVHASAREAESSDRLRALAEPRTALLVASLFTAESLLRLLEDAAAH
jgi:hypothetical protein